MFEVILDIWAMKARGEFVERKKQKVESRKQKAEMRNGRASARSKGQRYYSKDGGEGGVTTKVTFSYDALRSYSFIA